VLIMAYGSFRARMNRLRLFCKLVEDGDLTPALSLGVEKRPDDLTLLAKSFDAMRSRLAEQIGTDPLTGCLNRRALETRLRAEWRQAKRRGSTVAVLAIAVAGAVMLVTRKDLLAVLAGMAVAAAARAAGW